MITHNYVPKWYETNPDEEELLTSGMDIREGYVVLLADPILRADPEGPNNEYTRNRLQVVNRWAKVSEIELISDGQAIRFRATYDDDTSTIRIYSTAWPWYVKKDSL